MNADRVQRGLTVGVIALVALALLFRQFMPEPEPERVRGSAAYAHAEGRRALFYVLQRLGLEPELWQKSPGALPAGAHTLWMADAPHDDGGVQSRGGSRGTSVPSGRFDLTAHEHYLRFVEAGGTLIVPWTERIRDFLVEELDLEALAHFDAGEAPSGEPEPRRVRLLDATELEIALPRASVLPERLTDALAEPVWLAPNAEGHDELLAASIQVGEGAVVLLADDRFVDNDALGAASNAELAVRLLERSSDERLFLDEYALGRWEPETALGLAFAPDLASASWHILAAVVLFVWMSAWVRAFQRDPEPVEQLSPLSRAHAQANVLVRARRFEQLARFLRRGELARLARAARLVRPSQELANAAAVERELTLAADRVDAREELTLWKGLFLRRRVHSEAELDALAGDLDQAVERARVGMRTARTPHHTR